MKMTMHIDEDLLNRIVRYFGCSSKTEAVDMALREMDRQAKFREFAKTGLGFSPEELADSVASDYDPKSLRVAEKPTAYES